MKRETFPDPRHQYGSNPLTLESINVRERHALEDEAARYRAKYNALLLEYENAVELIKAAFEADRKALLAANWARRDAA